MRSTTQTDVRSFEVRLNANRVVHNPDWICGEEDEHARTVAGAIVQILEAALQDREPWVVHHGPGKIQFDVRSPKRFGTDFLAEHLGKFVKAVLVAYPCRVALPSLCRAAVIEAAWQPDRKDLDTDAQSVAELGRGSRRNIPESKQIQQGADASPRTQLAHDFTNASPGEIIAALQPEVPAAAIDRLQQLIVVAQTTPPKDKETFVAEINDALDSLNLRIEIGEGGQLARLKFNRTAAKGGSIQLGFAGGGCGFQGHDLRVVRVSPGARKQISEQKPIQDR